MAAKPRKRIQFKFWLDLFKPEESYLSEVATWLMEQGEFVRTIRDGIRLIYDMRFQKDYRSLEELFPDIRERLRVAASAPVASGGGQSDLAREIAEQIVLMGGSQYQMKSVIPTAGKPKEITSPVFAIPAFEDEDEPVMLVRKNTTNDASNNFITALRGMQ